MIYAQNKRRLALIGIDLLVLIFAYVLSFFLSGAATGGAFAEELKRYSLNLLVFVISIGCARALFRVYFNVWRYANARVYIDMISADLIGGAAALLFTVPFYSTLSLGGWQTIAIVTTFDLVCLVLRFIYQQTHKSNGPDSSATRVNVAIVGAGRVGSLLAEELSCFAGSQYNPVLFIDNNRTKIGSSVAGLPVFAPDSGIFDILGEYRVAEILIALPRLDASAISEVLDFYSKSGLKVKIYDFPKSNSEDSDKRVIREIKIEDLLFRRSINVADSATGAYYRDKVILVTGGGGSIGSELCRQIAKSSPKRLIIFDIYENNAYDIQQELTRRYGSSLDLCVEIGSVRDRARLEAVFSYYKPQVVFHAAAHKHVPLMEHSGCEAIKNNVFGTRNTADMAEKYGVEKFILVSTDKAVNPTNVMGASKRMCEMVIQCRTDSSTAFSAVRFGNVLGSNGSVIPLFKRQIAEGGPITITDRNIIRYFMTIPEASGLVMHAGAMAKCGELFVLDMGKPVRIIDLAENMIKLSGLRPGVDIQIKEIGLRPGEKLYEELLIKTEFLEKTENDLIFIEKDTPLTREEVDCKLEILAAAVKATESEIGSPAITAAMMQVVPTFHTPEEVNRKAEEAEEMKNVRVGV